MCIMARVFKSHGSTLETFHGGSEEIPCYSNYMGYQRGLELADVALWAISREEAHHDHSESESSVSRPASPAGWQGGWQDLESSTNSCLGGCDSKSEDFDEDEDSKLELLDSADNSDGEWKPIKGDRRKRRREQNKIAARRCREKKRQQALLTKKETEELQKRNAELRKKIGEMESKKRLLMELCSRKMKLQRNSSEACANDNRGVCTLPNPPMDACISTMQMLKDIPMEVSQS